MFVKHARKKKRHLLLSIIYRLYRFTRAFVPAKTLLPILLDLEWIIDRLANEETYRFYRPGENPVFKNSVAYITSKVRKDQKILDLGCGRGEIAGAVAKAGYQIVGIDQSASAIEIAKQKYPLPNLSFECAEGAEFLARSGEKFDVLLLSHVLEHLDEPAPFLRALVKHFDFFLLEVPDFEGNYLNFYRVDAKAKLTYSDDDHVTEFDRAEFLRIIEAAGLKVLDTQFQLGMLRVWCGK